MFAGCRRRLLSALLVVPFGALVLAPLAARADLLAEARARREIERQRIERLFTEERAAAYRLVRRAVPNLSAAEDKIQDLLRTVREAEGLEPGRRDTLIRTLNFDLKNLAVVARASRTGPRPGGYDPPPRPIYPKYAEEKRVADKRDRIRETYDSISGRKNRVDKMRKDRVTSGERVVATLEGVAKSGIPPVREYDLPPDWAEKSRKRLASAIKMTAKEKQILKAFGTVIDVDLTDASLSDVIDYLERKTGSTITIDKKAMDEASITYETKINLKVKATTRTVLKKLTADLGLTYVVKDERIHILTQAQANELMTVRTYYVGDLLAVTDARLGPVLTRLQMAETIQRLLVMVTQTVEPNTWQINNPEARGTIVFDPITMSLIVKQTAEVHFRMSGFR
jgi:hypothetical protein